MIQQNRGAGPPPPPRRPGAPPQPRGYSAMSICGLGSEKPASTPAVFTNASIYCHAVRAAHATAHDPSTSARHLARRSRLHPLAPMHTNIAHANPETPHSNGPCIAQPVQNVAIEYCRTHSCCHRLPNGNRTRQGIGTTSHPGILGDFQRAGYAKGSPSEGIDHRGADHHRVRSRHRLVTAVFLSCLLLTSIFTPTRITSPTLKLLYFSCNICVFRRQKSVGLHEEISHMARRAIKIIQPNRLLSAITK